MTRLHSSKLTLSQNDEGLELTHDENEITREEERDWRDVSSWTHSHIIW